MFWKISQQTSTSRILITLFLVFLLTACGAKSSNANHPQTTSIPTSGSVPTTSIPTSESAPAANQAPVSVDVSDLHIQSKYGIQCPDPETTAGGYVVLSTNRLTYSQSEMAQIAAYVKMSTYSRPTTSQPPTTLRWVSGASLKPIPGFGPAKICEGTLEITNTGNVPIQIPNVNARLLATPQQNTYQYRLINVCSLMPPSPDSSCMLGRGHVPACNEYTADIQLGVGKKDSVFSVEPEPNRGPSCGVLTIAPGAQAQLYLHFTPTPSTAKDLIYSLTPELTLNTTTGRHTVSLSPFTSVVSFADPSQFSCYQLQETTFVLMQAPKYDGINVWCI